MNNNKKKKLVITTSMQQDSSTVAGDRLSCLLRSQSKHDSTITAFQLRTYSSIHQTNQHQ